MKKQNGFVEILFVVMLVLIGGAGGTEIAKKFSEKNNDNTVCFIND